MGRFWALVLGLGVVGCGSDGGDGSSAGETGDCLGTVVTDIDETLTTADEEFFPKQTADGNYDPLEREEAAALIQDYAAKGYYVFYLTARPETLTVNVTDETAREATMRWLLEHDFPFDEGRAELSLAPEFVSGQATNDYKAGALRELIDRGHTMHYAYGNATTDISAYAEVGIAKDATFVVGENAGADGTVAIEGEGYAAHRAAHMPTVVSCSSR